MGRGIVETDYGTNGGSSFTRLTTLPTPSDTVLVVSTDYNPAGEAFSTTDPDSIETRRAFDHMGRLTQQIDNHQTSGSGTDINRTTEFTHTPGSQQKMVAAKMIDLPWIDYAGSPVDAARLKYDYDRDSLPMYRRDTVAHALSKGYDELYDRDGLNRLNDYQRGLLNGTNTAISTLDFEQDWSLNQVANWTNFAQDDDGDATDDLVQTRTHNKVNEITGITNTTGSAWIVPAYDAAGNTTTLPKPETPTAGFTAKYDAWNRLVALSEASTGTKVAEYTYDARNFRIRKEVHDGTGTLENTFDDYYTTNWQCVEEVETPVSGTGSLSQYVWGLRYTDDLVCRDKTPSGGSTTRLYVLSDRQFNIVAVVDTSGAVQKRVAYTPYGAAVFLTSTYATSTNTLDWRHLFQGLRTDEESGLIENRMRVLHPALGRFLQRDPLGYPDGMNAYAAYHVMNGRVDPAGLHPGHSNEPGHPPSHSIYWRDNPNGSPHTVYVEDSVRRDSDSTGTSQGIRAGTGVYPGSASQTLEDGECRNVEAREGIWTSAAIQ